MVLPSLRDQHTSETAHRMISLTCCSTTKMVSIGGHTVQWQVLCQIWLVPRRVEGFVANIQKAATELARCSGQLLRQKNRQVLAAEPSGLAPDSNQP